MELWSSIYLWWLAAAGISFIFGGIAEGINRDSAFHKLFKIIAGLILWIVLIVFVMTIVAVPFKIIF